MTTATTLTGTIKVVKADKGFGFIRRDDGSKDLFFHVHNTDRSLPFDESLVGRVVSFSVEESDRGPRAVNVKPAE